MRVGIVPTSSAPLFSGPFNDRDVESIGEAFGKKSEGPDDQQDELLIRRLRPVEGQFRAAQLAFAAESANSTKAGPLDRLLDAVTGLRDLVAGDGDAPLPAERQAALDAAVAEIGRLGNLEVRLGGPQNAVTSGLDRLQIAEFQVGRLAPDADVTISGEVLQAAEQATLTVLGDRNARVTDTATFRLTGDRGSATFSVRQGEQLSAVARRINEHAGEVGASARLSGTGLVLSSADHGSRSLLSLQQTSGAELSVTGVNDQQFVSFSASHLTPNSTETLVGHVVAGAEQAELRYVGQAGALVAGTATIEVTGAIGEATVQIARDESLSDVAERVNQFTPDTGVSAEVVGNELHFRSESAGSEAFVQIELVEQGYQVVTSGVNGSQVASLDVTQIAAGSQHSVQGELHQAAAQGLLTLRVAEQGVVADSSTFNITGNDGVRAFSVTSGESLAVVAQRINDDAASTGVTAGISGDDLLLSSVDTGDAATVAVSLTSVDYRVDTSGVDSQQIEEFEVLSFTNGAQNTLSGSITQAAEKALLSYQGTPDARIATFATFMLSGDLGSTEISVSALERLDDVAARINSFSQVTGVDATVSGTTLRLESRETGSTTSVGVAVTSGAFVVTGGNLDGTANGTDATAVVNGNAITGNGSNFSYSDADGSYTFRSADGFVGAFNPIQINSSPGLFDLSGGNGDGTANGDDAEATINGQFLTSASDRFSVDSNGFQFDVTFADGFSGVFDTIQVDSQADPFDLQGGDATGRADGADAVAFVNGAEVQAAGSQFTVQGQYGTYEFEFVNGFLGEFDPVAIVGGQGSLDVIGDDSHGASIGGDAVARINGEQRIGIGNTFALDRQGFEGSLTLAPGFSGEWTPFDVTARIATENESSQDESLGEVLQPLQQLVTGGTHAFEGPQGDDAGTLIDSVIVQLEERIAAEESVEQTVEDENVDSSTRAALSRAQVTAENFRALTKDNPESALAMMNLGGLESYHVKQQLLHLLQ